MALIKIVKEGQDPMIIPAGAYKMYAKAGWVKEKSSRRNKKEEEKPQVKNPEPEIEEPEVEEPEIEEEEEDVVYVDPEDLAKKPLGELDKEELQILAEYKGIDISKHTTSKQLREAIRALD